VLAWGYPDETVIQLFPCNQTNDRQLWLLPNSDLTIRLKADNKCLDISQYGTQNGAEVWLYACHTEDKDPAHQNQEWKIMADGTIRSTLSGKCLDVSNYGTSPGSIIQIWDCTGATNQQWKYSPTTGQLVGVQSGLCLDAGSSLGRPCDLPSNQKYPFCDPSLPLPARVQDILSRIPLDQKIQLFGNTAKNIPALNISSYQWWSEALHGVAGSPGVRFGGSTPYATSFPQIIGLGASGDLPLVSQVAQVISTEARGFNHEGNAGLTFWAPNVNIYRDPRWGRGQETPGEDPFLSSSYAGTFVSQMQGQDSTYLKVSSCCKHFTAYDLENWNGVDRHHFDAVVGDQDMMDTFMPPFKSCVEVGKASSLMCSYNEVNHVPSCAHKDFLTNTARATWGFQGYVTGDCGAVDDILYTHKYTSTTDETCKVALEAGLDLDCGNFLQEHLPQAITNGAVTQQDVDTALTHLFAVQFRLGMFDPDSLQPYRKITAADVNTPDHQVLALQAALESFVLLKNDGTLPLDKTKTKTIALIGPNALATTTMQGNYYGNAPYLVSPQAGLNKYVTTVYAKGCDINSQDKSGFSAACSAASSADATILVVGLDQSQESEGNDRTEINLPGVQNDLISQTTQCSKGPIIVVVMTGGPVDLSIPKSSQKVNSILWVGYPGQSGGDAIAKTIFGEYSPAGRLPYTIYPADYVNQLSMFDMNMRPSSTTPGRTYRFYTGTAVYPFGHGLSYTTFNYTFSKEPIQIQASDIQQHLQGDVYSPWSSKGMVDVTIYVQNTGNTKSDVLVQLYVTPADPGKNGNPLKFLAGFSRVHDVLPKQTISVVFPLTAHDLSLVDAHGSRTVLPGTWELSTQDTTKHMLIL